MFALSIAEVQMVHKEELKSWYYLFKNKIDFLTLYNSAYICGFEFGFFILVSTKNPLEIK